MPKIVQQQFNVLPTNAVCVSDLHATPSQVVRSWARDEPLVALIANGTDERWSRWSIIAPATGRRLTLDGPNTMSELKRVIDSQCGSSLLPNWIGYLGYELGHVIEPRTAQFVASDWPLVDMIWCDRALVHDGSTNTWWSIGDIQPPTIHEHVLPTHVCSALTDSAGDAAFIAAVDKAIQYIHKGDIFQANITRRFRANIEGNIRSAALAQLDNLGGWFGAWLEFPSDGRYVMSMSPELFLQVNGRTREVLTRPMKGTRPDQDDPETLLQSVKDAAELHMIVDLMRNDLGRVCKYGSIEVCDARFIEHHPTVWQCVGEVMGVLRDDVTICDLIEATFPAGSVTGAPKIRAMQIIHELEPSPRGPYCGAIGVLGQSTMLNVAIRTAIFKGTNDPTNFSGVLEYSTGCGIVAESKSDAELLESEVKTHIIRGFTSDREHCV